MKIKGSRPIVFQMLSLGLNICPDSIAVSTLPCHGSIPSSSLGRGVFLMVVGSGFGSYLVGRELNKESLS